MDELIYKGFARMYDALMADAPYDEWAAYIDSVFKNRLNIPECDQPLVLDLACGTGNMTLRLAKMGYDMIGVDASEDMLAEAQRKAYEAGQQILFLAQDMRKLDLYGTIDAAVSVFDGLNYILTEEGLRMAFERVKLFLNPGGIFIFDMNTEYKFKERFGSRSFEATVPSGEAYTWDNMYHEEKRINEYRMMFYSTEEKDCQPFEEMHYQRAYPIIDVCNMLFEVGFETVAVYDGYSDCAPDEHSTRVTFVASA